MQYFAYGSNLDDADWRAWCAANQADPDAIRRVGPAWLPDHEVVFDHLSVRRGCGTANLRRRVGQAVPGALFDVRDWGPLDRKEGGERHRVERALVDGGRCVTYRFPPAGYHAPSGTYLETVRRGLAALGLPDAQLLAAARGEVPEFTPRGLFVYGTLLPGECRHHHLGGARMVPATMRGVIHDLGDYPGFMDGEGTVVGERVTGDLEALLPRLDRVEGFNGFDRNDHWFRRTLREGTWVYAWCGEPGRPIPSGDWRRR